VILIGRRGVDVDAPAIEDLRAVFERRHFVLLPPLFEPEVLHYLLRRITAAEFVAKEERHDGRVFGITEFLAATDPAFFVFNLLLNNRDLFAAVRALTGCSSIGNFVGRIHRSTAGEHRIDWHDDFADHRLVGLNIDLSLKDYSGGRFQLRCKDEAEPFCDVGRIGLGRALLFRLSTEIEHRLTPITAGQRTVAVGWFRSRPDWPTFSRSFLRDTAAAVG